MKAAILSEFITSKSDIVQSCALYAVIAGVFAVIMGPAAALAAVGAMMPFVLMFTFCSLDDVNGWARFRASLPVSRSMLVQSRYANILLGTGAMLVVAYLVVSLIGAALGMIVPGSDMAASFSDELADGGALVAAGVSGACVTLFVCGCTLPFVLRCGMTKAMRIVPLVLTGAVFALFLALERIPAAAHALAGVASWIDSHGLLAMAVFALVVLALYAVSCALACTMYRSKEF